MNARWWSGAIGPALVALVLSLVSAVLVAAVPGGVGVAIAVIVLGIASAVFATDALVRMLLDVSPRRRWALLALAGIAYAGLDLAGLAWLFGSAGTGFVAVNGFESSWLGFLVVGWLAAILGIVVGTSAAVSSGVGLGARIVLGVLSILVELPLISLVGVIGVGIAALVLRSRATAAGEVSPAPLPASR
ncbi:hypothetical protein [Galbitalea soli]|uniref:Uncharacterized protein n=1 Tax=Galbitalea soli TaxID=1268042 RepID=A0A7C9PNB9_9MICO|nr:hypothetical protein [Galbitalea soli]NEM91308.1 hypothetical protein [Galbitalea soli]NYJ29997.1 hypothetical protein [Galbitalea soli]